MSFNLIDIDISLMRVIHNHRVVALDPVLYVISYSTTYISIAIVLAILIIALKKRSKALRVFFYKMLAVLVIAALISLTLKTIVQRDRPFKTYPDIEKLSEGGSPSFPSGHTLETFAIAMAFTLLISKKRYGMILFAWAIVVAYSRIALGVHYPFDVAGGMIIGALTGWLVPGLMNKIPALKSIPEL